GGHGEGTTSADEGRGVLFAIDRTAKKLDVIDPTAQTIVATAPPGADPHYVRYVEPPGEGWVTRPHAEQIEIFSLAAGANPAPKPSAVIKVPGGPESLVIEKTRGRAYTHLWEKKTVAIDLKTRAVIAQWPNGCAGSRGIALDEARGFL